jgi:hypothetical protein
MSAGLSLSLKVSGLYGKETTNYRLQVGEKVMHTKKADRKYMRKVSWLNFRQIYKTISRAEARRIWRRKEGMA